MWRIKVFETNYNTLGACVEDDDTGVHIYLKEPHELGIKHYDRHGYGPSMHKCLACKHKLTKQANKLASYLNLNTNEVEVF